MLLKLSTIHFSNQKKIYKHLLHEFDQVQKYT